MAMAAARADGRSGFCVSGLGLSGRSIVSGLGLSGRSIGRQQLWPGSSPSAKDGHAADVRAADLDAQQLAVEGQVRDHGAQDRTGQRRYSDGTVTVQTDADQDAQQLAVEGAAEDSGDIRACAADQHDAGNSAHALRTRSTD